jgi:peptidoglycan/xylan/chitin deacetylase (PgdA/CDA1 family)
MRFILIRKRTLVAALAAAFALAVLGVGVGVTDSAQVYLNSVTRKTPIFSVDTTEQIVSLTFDAAPGTNAADIEGIIGVLNKFDVKATFFLVGLWADQNEQTVLALDAAGMELGSHSNTHPRMIRLTNAQVALEIEAGIAAITDITKKPVELFRMPFGEYSDKLLTAVEARNLKAIQWDVDTSARTERNSAEISTYVINNSRAGSIILISTENQNSIAALPMIIEGLRNRGFAFKTVGEAIKCCCTSS